MKVALISTDNRECFKHYDEDVPIVPPPQEALLCGFAEQPDLEVHFISCLQVQPKHSPKKLAHNVHYHGLHVPKLGWMRTGYQGCIRAVRQLLQTIQPDVVHGHGTERECAMCATFSGFPNIITLHGIMASIHKATGAPLFSYYLLAKMLEEIALKRCDGIICISTQVDDFVASYPAKRWMIPNAIRPVFLQDSNRMRIAGNVPVLVNIGTISPYKRQTDLLCLLETLAQSFTFTAKFVGRIDRSTTYGGTFLDALSRAQKSGADFQHIETASAHELRTILDTSDCMVHYSSEESFGLVMAEGLARNLKLFCFDVGAANEFARLTDNCEVFPLGGEAKLASRLRAWLESYPKQPFRRTAPPQSIRREFSPESIARKHVQAYTELLGAVSTSRC